MATLHRRNERKNKKEHRNDKDT